MSKLCKMKNELRSASEVTLTNYMTGSGGREHDNLSSSNLDVIGLTNLANSDLNLTNTTKEVIISSSGANTVFNNNNNNNNNSSNRTISSLHQLRHLHHNHLHRPNERPTSWNVLNGNLTLSKYKSIFSLTFTWENCHALCSG